MAGIPPPVRAWRTPGDSSIGAGGLLCVPAARREGQGVSVMTRS
jgi:hypothetical protein